jgi:hypothetical protein
MLRTPNLIIPINSKTTFTDGPPSGRAWKVKDIRLDTWTVRAIDVTIDRRVVGRWANFAQDYGSHLGSVSQSYGTDSLPRYLFKRGVWPGYPVADGQSITLTNTVGSNCNGMLVVDEYDASDIRRDMTNGSDASEMVYVCYGSTGASISAAGEYQYTSASMPTGFVTFPFGATVPAGYQANVLALMFSGRVLNGSTGGWTTSLVGYKFMSQRQVLFAKDRTYIPCNFTNPGTTSTFYIGFDTSPSGDYTNVSYKEPWIFDSPLVFNEGEDLTIYGEVIVAGTPPALTTSQQLIAAIINMKKR